MDKRELAYVKQTLFAVKDWDAYQEVIRFWAKLVKAVGADSPRAPRQA